MANKKIGILTGGGDVPGLNSVIKGVVYRGSEIGFDVVGIRRTKSAERNRPAQIGASV